MNHSIKLRVFAARTFRWWKVFIFSLILDWKVMILIFDIQLIKNIFRKLWYSRINFNLLSHKNICKEGIGIQLFQMKKKFYLVFYTNLQILRNILRLIKCILCILNNHYSHDQLYRNNWFPDMKKIYPTKHREQSQLG